MIVVRVAFVPVLMTETVTPVTAAPVVSRTSPSMEPKVWPKATRPIIRVTARIRRRTCIEIVMD